MRLRQTLQGRRHDRSPRRSTRSVDRLRQGRGTRELDIGIGQANHADGCGTGHPVWRRLDLRRGTPHTRLLCARRCDHPERGPSRLPQDPVAARGVLRSFAAPAIAPHPPKPDPEAVKAQMEMQAKQAEMQAKLQIEREKLQLENELAKEKLAAEIAMRNMETAAEIEMKRESMQMEYNLGLQKTAMNAQVQTNKIDVPAGIS